MKIFFIRHGKDNDNYRGGWSRLDLTEEGRLQAEKLAEYIHSNNHSFNIKRIISSDLQRASTTAKLISDRLNIAVEYEQSIRETNNGDLAGMLNSEALSKYPGLFFSSLGMDEHYPNGESPSEFFSRIERWFSDFVKSNRNSNDNTVVVTHGGVINIVYHIVMNIAWTNKNRPFKVSNCSLHILNLDNMRFEVENFVTE